MFFNIKYGNILIKPRVSYGKGIRGVTRIYKEGQITPTYQTIPNQNIAPESQIGGDFGVAKTNDGSGSFGITKDFNRDR